MILGAVACLKMLLPILAGVFWWLKFKNTLSTKYRLGLAVLCVLFACFANMAAGHVPPLTDTVTLTALGETGQAGKGQEVFITGYTVDGEAYAPKNAVDGKWFWSGERYGWRPEEDPRKPEEITSSITLECPVGWDRQINFSMNEWRGWVEINGVNGKLQIDTSQVDSIDLGRSHTTLLALNQIVRLAVYLLIFLGCIALAWWGYFHIVVKKKRHIGDLLLQNYDQCICAACAIIFALICFSIKPDSLWGDELCQIAFSGLVDSPYEAIFKYYNTTPPLYTLLMYFWYQVAPYGEQWLFLPSVVFTMVSIYMVGRCGYLYGGKTCGCLAAFLTACSGVTLYQCALEYRTYGLLLMLASFTFYVYLKCSISDERLLKKYRYFYLLLMVLLAYTHYFGFFLCGALFLTDCILVTRHKKAGSQLWIYLVALISYIPWAIYVFKMQGTGLLAIWQGIPSFTRIIQLLQYLNGYVETRYVLFLVGTASVVAGWGINQKKKKKQTPAYEWICNTPVLTILIFVSCVFFYGKVISPQASLWVNRYFIVLLPMAMLICARGFTALVEWAGKYSINNVMTLFMLLLAIMWIPSTNIFVHEESPAYQPYREQAEWLLEQNDLYADTTLVLMGNASAIVEGWNEYYLTRQGQLDDVNLWGRDRRITADSLSQFERVYVIRTNSDQWEKALSNDFKQISYNSELKIWTYVHI